MRYESESWRGVSISVRRTCLDIQRTIVPRKHQSQPLSHADDSWTLLAMPFSVFALGSNSSGQLGVGHIDDTSVAQPCSFPAEICQQPDERVQNIVAGGNHTVVLTKKGRLLGSGNLSAFGSSRDVSVSNCTSFREIGLGSFSATETSEIVTDVAAAWETTFVILNRRRLYACGRGSKGELGLGTSITETQDFVFVKDFGNGIDLETSITTIVAAMNHVILSTSDGKVYGWGNSRKGQLGDEHKAAKVIWRPVEINISFQVRTAVAGRDFSFMLGVDGEQMLLGERKHFQSDGPLFPSICHLHIHGGWSTIYAQRNGALHVAGRNNAGQMSPGNLPNLKYFAAGSEHCIACTSAGDVIAWGWNEHGNCGRLSETLPAGHNSIPIALEKGESILGVAAGCATSFIICELTMSAPK